MDAISAHRHLNDRIGVVARKMGSKGNSAITGPDWRAMLDQFDAAVVAVPHALHASIGTGLAEAGKHIFMEKPLATKVADCQRLLAAANASGVTLSVGLLRRYLRIVRWTKALIASGTLGEIRHFDAREGFVFNWDTSTDAILSPGLSGGGVLMDTGAHTLDLIAWWFGTAASVDYCDDAKGGVEADCVVKCKMVSGATGRIELSRTRELQELDPHRWLERLRRGSSFQERGPGRLEERTRVHPRGDQLRQDGAAVLPGVVRCRAARLYSEDRQLLLDAISAATEKLVITYTGANEYSGQERPPAVPLAELLDTLDMTTAGARFARRSSSDIRCSPSILAMSSPAS